jgi:hypothetical protein
MDSPDPYLLMPSPEETPWHAAWNGDLAVIRECLEQGGAINTRGFILRSLLFGEFEGSIPESCP